MLKDQIKKFFSNMFISQEWIDFNKKNMEPFRCLMTFYQCAMMQVQTKINVLNEQFSLEYDRNPIESIKTRLKSPESIVEKMRRRKLPVSIESIEENITDIAGVRVICSFPEDIYLLADCLLRQDDVTLVVKKDYIKEPKPGGYRSLHLIIQVPIFLRNEKRLMNVEVQLRTIAMDFWASLEHKLRYKKSLPPEEQEAIAKDLHECAEISSSLDYRMERIKNRLSTGDL